MGKSQLLIAAVVVAAATAAILSAADAGEEFIWIQNNSPEISCQGSITECAAEGEFEINRRILATKTYIGYGALKPDNVPCPYRGASYYNCRNDGQANPYGRACTAATKCERNG